MYKEWNPKNGESQIVRLSDTAFISKSEDNHDYRQFLLWLAEGNVLEEWSDE